MKMFTRASLALALVLALSAGFGCAKKEVAVTPEQTPVQESVDQTSSEDAAMAALAQARQDITDARIFFAFDKYDLSDDAKAQLQEKAAIMKQFPEVRVLIAGNCDNRGTQEYNLALGERRARAALDYMVQLGVNPSQMEIISYGKERPLDSANTPAGWAMNRRDDFVIIR